MPFLWGNTIISFPVWTPALTLGYVGGYFLYSMMSKTPISLFHLGIVAVIGTFLTVLSIRWFRKKNDTILCHSLLYHLQFSLHETSMRTKIDWQCQMIKVLQSIPIRMTSRWDVRKVVLLDMQKNRSFTIGMTNHPIGSSKIAHIFHQFFGIDIPSELSATAASVEWNRQLKTGIYAILFFTVAIIIMLYMFI